MIKLQWDSKFEVGHERIDHEHQVFLNLIRSASDAADNGSSKARVLRLLTEVQKYAEFHFVSEENIMIDIDYPEYSAHHQEHTRLLARLEDEFLAYGNDEISLEHIVDFLFEWFAIHTTRRDQQLAQYIYQESPVDL